MDFAGKDFIYLSKIKKDKVRKIRKSEEDNKGDAPLPNPIIASSNIESKLNKYSQNFNKPRKGSVISDDSDDGYIKVNSNNFAIDLVNPDKKLSNPNINMMNMNNNMNMQNNMNIMNNMNNMNMMNNMNNMNNMNMMNNMNNMNNMNRQNNMNMMNNMNNMNMMNNMNRQNNMNMMNNINRQNNMNMMNNMNINLQAAPGIDYKKAIDTNVCVIRYNSLETESTNIIKKIFQCQKCKSYLNKYSNLKNIGNNNYEWNVNIVFI